MRKRQKKKNLKRQEALLLRNLKTNGPLFPSTTVWWIPDEKKHSHKPFYFWWREVDFK